MTIIKKIINWLINLLKKLFGKNKKLDKDYKKFNLANSFFDESIPSYIVISDNDKEKLIYSINVMKNMLKENYFVIKEKEELELLEYIKKINNVELINKIDNKPLTMEYIKSLIKKTDDNTKKDIVDKYQIIKKREEEFQVCLSDIDRICKKISNNDISLIVEGKIENEIDDIVSDKNIGNELNNKVDLFNKNVYEIIDKSDTNILEEVVREYKKVNYVTLSTVIIDKNYNKFKKLKEDFKNHRFNRYYYEREINKIKRELNKIKNLKKKKEVNDHILNLRKELYTKSKDKYDLLYNNEVFINIDTECNNLLSKINTKVIDINKEINTQKVQKKDIYLQNILRRFEDMDLARTLILKEQEEDVDIKNTMDLENYIKKLYNMSNDKENDEFNFERNKDKTEFVVLYNGINKLVSKLKKEPYIPVDHINFRMKDLQEAVKVKKMEFEDIISKKNIMVDDTLVNQKIEKYLKDK